MSKPDKLDTLAYQVVSTRVSNWHQLLWQVPLFAFTAQAFTFTIALQPESTPTTRVIACVLSLLISLVSLVTLVRQRKADKLDSGRASEIETQFGWSDDLRLHGPIWADRRERQPFDWPWLDRFVGKWTLTITWTVAFLVLIALALGVAVLALAAPALLTGVAADPTPTPAP